jgi:alginate O-acetyltransferase complex protein AlgJ
VTETEPLAAGPDVLESPPPPREGRVARVIIAALGASLLFGPWAAAAIGARSDPVPGENRALAGRPSWHGFETFDDVTAFAADRFPLRDLAIRANKRFTTDVFGENPSYASDSGAAVGGVPADKPPAEVAQVITGTDGWLYFFDDFRRACRPDVPLEKVLDGVRRMDALLTASGRRLVITVPPDKSTADPQFLPADYVDRACSVQAKAARWQALAGLDVPGYVDVRSPVEAQEKKTGVPAYLPLDTHWTQLSSTIFVQELAKELDPSLAAGSSVVPLGPVKYGGDLSAIAGTPQFGTEAAFGIRRRGVTVTTREETLDKGYVLTHVRGTAAGGAALFQPRTVVIGDSFTQRALDKMAPYFADMTRVPELSKAILAGNLPQATDRMLQEIAGSKVVVVELVERTFAGAKDGSPFSEAFLDRLEATLASAPRQP